MFIFKKIKLLILFFIFIYFFSLDYSICEENPNLGDIFEPNEIEMEFRKLAEIHEGIPNCLDLKVMEEGFPFFNVVSRFLPEFTEIGGQLNWDASGSHFKWLSPLFREIYQEIYKEFLLTHQISQRDFLWHMLYILDVYIESVQDTNELKQLFFKIYNQTKYATSYQDLWSEHQLFVDEYKTKAIALLKTKYAEKNSL